MDAMKLQAVGVGQSVPFVVYCKKCGLQCRLMRHTIYADLDGEPFEDYYCVSCADELMKGQHES